MTWWRQARFGLFIHFGLYAIPGRGEWVQWNEQIPVGEYAKLASQFTLTTFDANSWAETAKAAGMKYVVLTARHHDGFALFDDPGNPFTTVSTAAHRDVVKEYVAAVRKAGLHVGLYYSPLDWRFPGFIMPDLQRQSAKAMRDQFHRQVTELLSNYGKIDVLWFDGGETDWLSFAGQWNGAKWEKRPKGEHYHGGFSWQSDQLCPTLRKLQPDIIINGRADMPEDFHTREGDGALGDFDNQHPWELCSSINGVWGYQPNRPPRSLKSCIQLLAKVAGRDGNLLLNVGPRPDGQIDPPQVARLHEVGDWLGKYGASIYDTRGGPFLPGNYGASTSHDHTVYLHVLNWPEKNLVLPDIHARVLNATALTGGKAAFVQSERGIEVSLPPTDRSDMDTVIALQLDQPASTIAPIAVPSPDNSRQPSATDSATIRSGQIWPDTTGQQINAHCGDIVPFQGAWYWFGENRNGDRRQITCYRSTNLKDWTRQNIVLKNLGAETGFTERPKVIYNDQTKQFVMWMHKEGKGGYSEARAAVAVCDTIDGDYRYLGSFRPLNNMSRDDYLFKDDDGAAYFISTSSDNADLKIYRLTNDYLKIDHEVTTLFKGQYREAPVVFKRNGLYYLLTSFCTGTKANPQYYSMATSMSGPWSENHLLTARRTWNTYYSQGACEFTVRGSEGATYIYNLDRWVKPMRHVWLPLDFNADGTIKPLEWADEWSLNTRTGLAVIPPPPTPLADDLARGKPVTATYDSPGAMLDYGHFANHEPGLALDGDLKTAWSPNDNLPHWLKVDLKEPADLSGVEFTFWKAGANAYRIEVSADGTNWKPVVHSTSSADTPTVRHAFTENGVRDVRVWLLGSNRGYNWPGIAELKVLSHGLDVAPGKPATADDYQARTDASKAVDGDFSTAWTIDNGRLPQSLTVDLGSAQAIHGVRILWEATGVAHRYRVETSPDQKAWSTAVDQTASMAAVSQPEHRFTADARYVRLTLTGYDTMGGAPGKSMSPWPGVREFEIIP